MTRFREYGLTSSSNSRFQFPLIHLNHRNGTFLRRPCFSRLRLRTTVPGRGCSLSIRSRSSHNLAFSADDFAKEIDGKSVAKKIRDEITIEITTMEESIKAFVKKFFGNPTLKKYGEFTTELTRMNKSIGVVPGLAVIIVGNIKDSATYARNKMDACESIGFQTFPESLPEDSSEEEVLKYISDFNNDPCVHGIIVQLPLPLHMNEENILDAISVEKNVDGFHPTNIRLLAMRGRREEPLFNPCIAKGCVEWLHRSNIEIKGKRAVVIGWSNNIEIKGKIRAAARLFLKKEDVIVTVIHSKTKKRAEIAREADIIIAAAGKPNMVRGSWIKPGAVIIDVGINPVEDPNAPHGYRLVGDVCYEEASKVASAITPLPGGVGVMTIGMVLLNILTAAERIHNFQ